MTKAEILLGVRYLINVQSTDAGALLSDTGNLLDFAQDAMEQVVLDLVPVMPDQLLDYEDITLVANDSDYDLTKTFWQVVDVQRNVTGSSPVPLRIIDPSDLQYFKYIGQTDPEPAYCWFRGSSINFVPTPSSAYSNYCRVYIIKPEAVAIPTNGPAYLPAPTHRLIVYQTAMLAATMLGAQNMVSLFSSLYGRRFMSIKKMWQGRFQQQPRFVKESVILKTAYDDREHAFYDTDPFFTK